MPRHLRGCVARGGLFGFGAHGFRTLPTFISEFSNGSSPGDSPGRRTPSQFLLTVLHAPPHLFLSAITLSSVYTMEGEGFFSFVFSLTPPTVIWAPCSGSAATPSLAIFSAIDSCHYEKSAACGTQRRIIPPAGSQSLCTTDSTAVSVYTMEGRPPMCW